MSKKNGLREEPRDDINCCGFRIFFSFLNGDLEASDQDLIDYVVEDLKLPRDKMPKQFVEYLPAIVAALVHIWPGWRFRDNHLKGLFSTYHYFRTFQKYMMGKVHDIAKREFVTALEEVQKEANNKPKLKGNSHKLETSPVSIDLQCPALMLNTVIFSNCGDDVVMKVHVGPKWLPLKPGHLLHWPYIQVEFKTEDLHFRRLQATEYSRYLDVQTQQLTLTTAHIERAQIIDKSKSQQVFALRYVEAYISDYISAIESFNDVAKSKVVEIKDILSNFLLDIEAMKVNSSIATNTDILFRLSRFPYIRNKKLVRHGRQSPRALDHTVGYCEIIIPKVQLQVLLFSGEQIEENCVKFVYPEALRTNAEGSAKKQLLPEISYRCTFCEKTFASVDSKEEILRHLREMHSMEQPVQCVICKQNFEVTHLVETRWQHKACTRPNS